MQKGLTASLVVGGSPTATRKGGWGSASLAGANAVEPAQGCVKFRCGLVGGKTRAPWGVRYGSGWKPIASQDPTAGSEAASASEPPASLLTAGRPPRPTAACRK